MDKVFKQVATSVGQGCAAAMQTTRWLEEFESDHHIDLRQDPRDFGIQGIKVQEPLGTW